MLTDYIFDYNLLGMKYCLAVVLTVLISYASGQQISGNVYDLSGKPVSNATVILLAASDSTEIKYTVTDDNGHFGFSNHPAARYLTKVSAVNYITTFSEIFELSDSNIELPTLILTDANNTLSAVTVVAKKPPVEVKAGRTLVNVDASPTNAGLNALEILEKSPGVSVDNDGNVSLKGKGGVIILIDGKQTYLSGQNLASFLKSLQASGLDQVEIMTNPPAKYDAVGGAGIINIKTKKGTIRGMNGNANFNYAQGMYPRYNGGANFNYRNKNINVFGGYNGGYWNEVGVLTLKRNFYANGNAAGRSEQITNRHNNGNWHNAKIGMDYNITSKDVVGFVVNGNMNTWKSLQKSTSLLKDAKDDFLTEFISDAYNGSRSRNITTNINYKHSFDSTGRELTADVDYGYYNNRGKNLLETKVLNEDKIQQGNNIYLDGVFPSITKLYTAKIDYVHPFSKTTKLETGVKTSFVNIDNDVFYKRDTSTGWFTDVDRSNQFAYSENINAVYTIVSTSIKKWELSGGLRLENTNAKGRQVIGDSSFTRHYVNLFPNASVLYSMNDNNQWGLSYSRRIRRPNYDDLNPFLFFLDSLTYGQGNPYLQPQFSNNVELSHTFSKFFTTTLNYTQTDNIITEILKQDTERKTLFQTKENFASMRQWGVTVTANKQILKWWNANIYANVFSNSFKGSYMHGSNNVPITLTVAGFMGNMTNSFSFGKTWTAEVSGWFTNRISEGLLIGGNMGALNMAVAKQVFKKNGTIKVGIRDIFRTQNFNGYSRYADVDVDIFNNRRMDNRQVNISFTYKFGKSSVAPARNRRGSADDEQGRIKS